MKRFVMSALVMEIVVPVAKGLLGFGLFYPNPRRRAFI